MCMEGCLLWNCCMGISVWLIIDILDSVLLFIWISVRGWITSNTLHQMDHVTWKEDGRVLSSMCGRWGLWWRQTLQRIFLRVRSDILVKWPYMRWRMDQWRLYGRWSRWDHVCKLELWLVLQWHQSRLHDKYKVRSSSRDTNFVTRMGPLCKFDLMHSSSFLYSHNYS